MASLERRFNNPAVLVSEFSLGLVQLKKSVNATV